MSPWLVAVGAGAAFALVQYGWRRTHQGPLWLTAACCRCAAVSLIVALLLDAPAGPAQSVRVWAAIDASQSMQREDSLLWRSALDSAAAERPESTLWFGDSARRSPQSERQPIGRDTKSELRPVADRAAAAGHPVVVITDGEINDPESIGSLPAGSRLIVLAQRAATDAAVTAVDLPRAAVAGDTITSQVTIGAGAQGASAGRLTIRVDGRDVANVPV